MKYLTTQQDFTHPKCERVITGEHTDYYNALFDVESVVTEFVMSLDGTQKETGKVLEKREFLRVKDALPPGHYIVVNSTPSRDNTKMTIWQKRSEDRTVPFFIFSSRTVSELVWRKVRSVFLTVKLDKPSPVPANPVNRTRAHGSGSARTRSRDARDARDSRTPELEETKKRCLAFSAQLKKTNVMKNLSERNTYSNLLAVASGKVEVSNNIVSELRNDFPEEFLKCPMVVRARVARKQVDLSPQEQLCASILQRCDQLRKEVDAHSPESAPDITDSSEE